MDTYIIDIELEHYYGDRMAMSNREACRRLYVRAVSRFSGQELQRYLHRVRSHARAYAALSRMLRSPFRHMEAPLFLSSLILLISSITMMLIGNLSPVVAGGTAAALVGMMHCARKLIAYRRRHRVREAVFRELAETLFQEHPY